MINENFRRNTPITKLNHMLSNSSFSVGFLDNVRLKIHISS